jgi:demethylmenaquinone methyltransferase/2-methoxy-6-polyprenyl-1,4-benzoquinol methylase
MFAAMIEGPREKTGTEAEAWFGDRPVPPEAKAGLVRGVFDSVAGRYDLMNDLMSAGVHRLWKRALVDAVKPQPGELIVDVAGGTGDIAFRLLERLGGGAAAASGARVLVCDLTRAMLEVGRDRAIDRGLLAGIDWLAGDAERLPVADLVADAYVIAFGLRNVTHIDRALGEAYRVLKPGGRFFCLEFSRVLLPLLDRAYALYSDAVLPALGRIVAGDEPAYRYLIESIRRFPAQAELARRIEAAGFRLVRCRNLSGGIAAIHSAWRI